jgi:hypothetical protein
MAYRLPTFNLSCNIWHNPAVPPAGAADVSPMANLTPGRRVTMPSEPIGSLPMQLLLPALTDVRIQDIVECPAGTARWYEVLFVDDAGKGFANEHRIALLVQTGIWPAPIP